MVGESTKRKRDFLIPEDEPNKQESCDEKLDQSLLA